MSKFNTAARPHKIENLAGGEAFAQSPELELVSLMLTSFVEQTFYRSADATLGRLVELLPKVDPYFAAKLGVYARQVFGMRSISHALAAELAPYISKQPYARSFYAAVIKRPDDMTEILAYYTGKRAQTKIPAAMKAGFATAFNRFEAYQLGKYRGEGNAKKLIDVVNLVHPKGTETNSAALGALVKGDLRQAGTWEGQLTAIGQSDVSDTQKAADRASVWNGLLSEGKLGYLALVRNLRNIIAQAPAAVPLACAELRNRDKVQKSLIMPFQLVTAYKQLSGDSSDARTVRAALDEAIELSCANVPDLPNTLVVVDNSGSMSSPVTSSQHIQCAEAGAAFGMILAKRSNADIMEFGTTARYIPYDLNASVLNFASRFQADNQVGHGTDFHAIFQTAKKAYDRIVIFSDMQGWIGHYSPEASFKAYRQRTGAKPFIYSFDLRGLGSMQFPEPKIFALAGFSGEIFNVMSKLETDRAALLTEIKSLDITKYVRNNR